MIMFFLTISFLSLKCTFMPTVQPNYWSLKILFIKLPLSRLLKEFRLIKTSINRRSTVKSGMQLSVYFGKKKKLCLYYSSYIQYNMYLSTKLSFWHTQYFPFFFFPAWFISVLFFPLLFFFLTFLSFFLYSNNYPFFLLDSFILFFFFFFLFNVRILFNY